MQSQTLFNAVVNQIEEVAEARNETASSAVEAFTGYDKSIGRTQVRMRFSGKTNRTLRMELAGGRRLTATFSRGDDVICGRDHSVQSREKVVLHLAGSNQRLADKKLMKEWLLSCVERFRKPPKNIVEVIALDQTSTDWIPEWQTRCVRSIKKFEGVGNGFFLKRQSIMPILADASTWCGKELRIYLIIGPPGTGKTELTIWLAGYLRVPLYRLSLNDVRLSDPVFAQLVSPTSLRHDNAVIQIDEFQETLARWQRSPEKGGVSMGGFCEVLQGSNSLTRGFIVLSGTQELARTMQDPVFSAVFRRMSIPPVLLDWLTSDDLQTFVRRFIADFVPGSPLEDMSKLAKDFVMAKGSPWSTGRISIDMVKRFLMERISMFRATELSAGIIDPGVAFSVPASMRQKFFDYICDKDSARAHLRSYPSVGDCVSVAPDEGTQGAADACTDCV
eukprot:TRINITY_DN18802_c0_g1_i1.p1 TRINITY_DN18802_c0_g1~~TRINITY_DN18802_c0_g1_i1.p1  ORF type:complete len:447 (+),score=82.06 TRINITY_DN18802_c0_g1_i1:486-1826(+)